MTVLNCSTLHSHAWTNEEEEWGGSRSSYLYVSMEPMEHRPDARAIQSLSLPLAAKVDQFDKY